MDFGEALYTNLFITKKTVSISHFDSTVKASWGSVQYFSNSSILKLDILLNLRRNPHISVCSDSISNLSLMDDVAVSSKGLILILGSCAVALVSLAGPGG